MCDGKTGKPRTVIDIEKAAKLTVKEGPLRFVEQSRPNSPYSPETELEVALRGPLSNRISVTASTTPRTREAMGLQRCIKAVNS